VLPYSHPFIMNAHEVIAQTLHFLRHGRFLDRERPLPRDGGPELP